MGGELFSGRPIGRMPPRTLVLALLVAAIFLLLLWPHPAAAGTYDVYACRLPDGSPAPTHGWTPFSDSTEQNTGTRDGCASGEGMTVLLPWAFDVSRLTAGWRFDTPVDT